MQISRVEILPVRPSEVCRTCTPCCTCAGPELPGDSTTCVRMRDIALPYCQPNQSAPLIHASVVDRLRYEHPSSGSRWCFLCWTGDTSGHRTVGRLLFSDWQSFPYSSEKSRENARYPTFVQELNIFVSLREEEERKLNKIILAHATIHVPSSTHYIRIEGVSGQ